MGKGVHAYNSLAFVFPDLALEWHPTRNGELTPDKVTAGSNKKVWWRCERGHDFDCSVVARTKRGTGCRFCKRQEVCLETCLATVNPELAKQWHPTLNGKLTPFDVFPNTSKKAYWLCEYEHITFSSIAKRNQGGGCGECQKGTQTSFAEQAIYFYLAKVFPDSLNRYKINLGGKLYEADIFLPSFNLAVEYDGYYHHNMVEKDELKCQAFREHGVKLIRVRLDTLPEIRNDGALILKHAKHDMQSLNDCLACIFDYIVSTFDVTEDGCTRLSQLQPIDIQDDELGILGKIATYKLERSIAVTHPHLVQEWDFDLNGNLRPEQVTAGVATEVWWACEKGHPPYKMAVNKRTDGASCNVCAGKVVIRETSLLSTHPALCQEWDFELNTDISPEAVSHGSDTVVWWRCELGHQYQASISSRTRKKPRGCSYCNGQAVDAENSLASLYPRLAQEWDYEKNGDLLPNNVRSMSNKRVYWKCKQGHSWQAVISSRSDGASGCPYCQGLLATPETSLAMAKPNMAAEWDYEKNSDLTPFDVLPKSGKRVWWKCSKNHSWDATIVSRSNGSGCPYCSGRKACDDNCLATVEPDVAKEWHPTKNGDLSPNDVTRSSRKKIWWLCRRCGKEWEAFVYSRSNNGICKCNTRKQKSN